MTERGRSPVYEKSAEPVETGEAVLTLVSVEKQDEDALESTVAEAATEIGNHARQLKVGHVVLNPFAHLFGELGRPSSAIKAMKLLNRALVDDGLEVSRIPFGWFNTLEIRAKGHPLSRVARTVPRG